MSAKRGNTNALRLRAFWLGITIVVIQSAAAPYNNYVVQGPSFGGNHFPTISIFILAILTAFNRFSHQIQPGLQLKPTELAAIWVMSLVTAGIPSKGVWRNLLPMMVSHSYFSTPENQWQPLFSQWLSPWLVVKEHKTAVDFFEMADLPVPWSAWMKPLIFWTLFILVLYFTITCLCRLLYWRWVNEERLLFPLMQLPVGMVNTPIFNNQLMWLGFSLPVAVYLFNGLNKHFPSVPAIPLTFDIYPYFTEKPWSAMASWPQARFMLLFSIVGIGYLVPTEISLSIWFFYVFYKLQQIAVKGFELPIPHSSSQAMGSVLVIALYILWKAKGRIKSAVLGLVVPERFGGEQSSLKADYVFWGFIIGTAILVLQLSSLEAAAQVSLMILVFYFLVSTVLTWMVVQGGLLRVQAPFYPSEYLEHSLGIRITGYKNLAILMVPQHALMRDWWEVPMPHIMHALRMPDLIKTDRGRFIWLVVAAIIIRLGVSCYASLSLIYKEGGLNLGYGGVWTSRQPYKRIASFLLHPSSPNRAYSIGIFIGSLVTWIMLFLRSTFLWWPLHPIGYALGASHSPYTIWSSFLLAWVIKFTLLRTADIGIYRRWQPFFFGLVLGEYSMAGFWMIISIVTQVGYNFFPW